jgi:hypothetical protein
MLDTPLINLGAIDSHFLEGFKSIIQLWLREWIKSADHEPAD